MILATVPSWANTTSVMPPTYSLSNAPSTSGSAVSTREVKPVISVKIAATSRRCTSMPGLSPSEASLAAICGEKYRDSEACARSASACRRRASRIIPTWRMVLSIVISRSEKSIGLVRKSNAPRFIAVRILLMSPYAETIMVDILSSASCSFSSSDSPSIRGMLISDTTMSTSACCSIDCSASMPSCANTNATAPSRICLRNFCSTRASRSGSSSTTRIVTVMQPVQAWYRSRDAAGQNRSAWSGGQPHHAQSPCGGFRHRHRR